MLKKITFYVEINAPAEKVWNVLWDEISYCHWTSAFGVGSYVETDWKEGSRAHFLLPSGEGMYVEIAECIENKRMVFRHLGEIRNFEEVVMDDAPDFWGKAFESYNLEENNGVTTLTSELDTVDEYVAMFEGMFPKAFQIIKQLSEDHIPRKAMVAALIHAPIGRVWEYRTNPEHIKHWNAASDDWHTPHAKNDLKPGGKFSYRMERKDGKQGFDFDGTFTAIEPNKNIEYTLSDGRKSSIIFSENSDKVTVVEYFELENSMSAELQRTGWQAIMDNFKQYVEGDS